MQVRAELPDDAAAIRAVICEAFGQEGEADLVEALRAAGALTCSLVAIVDDAIVGHVAFSPVHVDATPAIGLAPVAVRVAHQRRGIGDALIREGLARLAAAGHELVIVLGHPRYYPRFGFVPAHQRGISWEHPVDPASLMVLELRPGAARPGVVRYHPAFAAVS